MSHQMQAIETFCNMRNRCAENENHFHPARFARSCHAVYHREHYVLYTIFGERARSASGLKQVLTKGGMGVNENHSQLDMTSDISAIFWP